MKDQFCKEQLSKSCRKKFTTMLNPNLRRELKIISVYEEKSMADIFEMLVIKFLEERRKEKRPF